MLGLGGHPLAAAGIVPKDFPEMQAPNLLIVGFQAGHSVSGAIPVVRFGLLWSYQVRGQRLSIFPGSAA